MCNLFKIFKKQAVKPTIKDIEVINPEVVQPEKQEVMEAKPIDNTTIKRIELLHPVIRQEVKDIYREIVEKVNSKYCQVRFSDTLRTFEQQEQLYAKGRTKPGHKVTWAKAGYSYHNYGLAVDIVLLLDKDKNGTFESASWDTTFDGDNDRIADWLEVVKIFNSYGWQWGLINSKGKRYDLPHFQKTFGYKTSQLKKMKTDKFGYPILSL